MKPLWTKESLRAFLVRYPVVTGGAITPYTHSEPVEKDDGDVWYEIEFPFWPNNDEVIKSLLLLVLHAMEEGLTSVYLVDGSITLQFYTSVCDPD